MSRPLRMEYPGAWYHVMNRGRRREKIFPSVKDYGNFIAILQEAVTMWNLDVAAYCLMENHYHLLLHTPAGNLSRCMRHINGVYTQRYNRLHENDGQLFRGRYTAILIDSENYLLEVLRYIHRNPVNVGIVKSVEDFPWSSHKAYLSSAKQWDWLYRDFLLAHFSEKRALAKKAYVEFVHQKESEEIEGFYGKKYLKSILGTEDFREQVKEDFQHLLLAKDIAGNKELAMRAEDVRAAVVKVFGARMEDLMCSRRGTTNAARDVAIFLQRKYCRQTLAELAKNFGVASYSTASSANERVKARLVTDKAFQKQIEKIEKILNKRQKQT